MKPGVGHLAQSVVYSDEELLVSLSNSLRLREREIAERATLKGRLMKLFVGADDGKTIRIDGMRLKQLLELAGGSAPDDLALAGLYEVNLEYFRVLLGRVLPSDGPTRPVSVVRR